jgi:branched-chain amino acid transport system ATP-binding protein
MDEPASGMNPAETRKLADDIRRIHARGLTVILIEHDVSMVTDLCEEIVVLNFGKKISQGNSKTVTRDPEVIAAYLGSKYKAHA